MHRDLVGVASVGYLCCCIRSK